MLDGIGMFSDDIRDMIRGHIFYNKERGYVAGKSGMENAVRFCVTGGIWHPQVDYAGYGYGPGGPWTESPEAVINYASCHDNLTLWDKFLVSKPEADVKERLTMNRLAAALVFTSQGVPFFLSGEEFARSKPVAGTNEVSDNSYNLPFETNALRYDWTQEQKELQQYYKGLIAFRKKHPALRMQRAEEIREKITFMEGLPEQVVAFTICHEKEILFIAYNASGRNVTLLLPDEKDWKLYIDESHAGTECLRTCRSTVELPAIGCVVLAV